MSGQHTGAALLVALVRAAADPASEEALRRAVDGLRSVLRERLGRRPIATVALGLGVSHGQVRAAARLLGVDFAGRPGAPPRPRGMTSTLCRATCDGCEVRWRWEGVFPERATCPNCGVELRGGWEGAAFKIRHCHVTDAGLHLTAAGRRFAAGSTTGGTPHD